MTTIASGTARRHAIAAILFTVLVAGCGTAAVTPYPAATSAAAGNTSAGPGGSSPAAMSADDALATYGYAPSPSPSVKLQPDVVIVGGGASSIQWASADGHTWAIDPAAPGASALKVGSVMFLTSRAVGRVAELSDQGGSRIVALAPVQLGELFSSADFHLDQALDPSAVGYQTLPNLPGTVTDLSAAPSASPGASGGPGLSDSLSSSGETVVAAPTIRLASYRGGRAGASGAVGATTADQLPPVLKVCHEVTLGDHWSIKPCVQEQKIDLGIDYKTAGGGVAGGGLKFGAVVTMKFNDLHTTGDVHIQDGGISNSTVLLEGVNGIDVSLGAGAADPASDNRKLKFEVPIEVETPIPPSPATLGIPLNLVLEFKAIVEVALGGKNSTLSAAGSYVLSGPLGVRSGSVVAPVISVAAPLIKSISGIALGASGLVLAAKFKIQLGLGMDGFVVGPYAVTTISAGISMGSAIGSPIADCTGASINMWVGGGFGATVDFTKFKTFLPDALTKFKNEVEKTWNVYTVDTTFPDVPVCKS